MRNTTNRPLYKDPTTKVDCSRRQDGEQQPGKAVDLYEKLKRKAEWTDHMLRLMMDRLLFNGWLEKFDQQLERGTR